MPDRSYLSIGDVLNLLKDEFPDVTISKIRFLESQGLLDPERTPSGYRKFYDADVERLRWILRQQKEHFLPLKVIKGRLEPATGRGSPAPHPAGTESPAGPSVAGPSTTGPRGSGTDNGTASRLSARDRDREAAAGDATVGDGTAAARLPIAGGPPEDVASPVGPLAPPLPDGAGASTAGSAEPAAVSDRPPAPAPAPERPPAPARSPAPAPPRAPAASSATPVLSVGASGVSLTFDELVEACGLEEAAVRDLERYGLIVGRPVARTMYYDEESLVVGRLAAEFRRFGVEARHLRMYKTAAEREAGFFEQIVTPLLKQRNPRSRGEAIQTAQDLAELGGRLRDSMLRLALRDLTGG